MIKTKATAAPESWLLLDFGPLYYAAHLLLIVLFPQGFSLSTIAAKKHLDGCTHALCYHYLFMVLTHAMPGQVRFLPGPML